MRDFAEIFFGCVRCGIFWPFSPFMVMSHSILDISRNLENKSGLVLIRFEEYCLMVSRHSVVGYSVHVAGHVHTSCRNRQGETPEELRLFWNKKKKKSRLNRLIRLDVRRPAYDISIISYSAKIYQPPTFSGQETLHLMWFFYSLRIHYTRIKQVLGSSRRISISQE